MIVRSNILNEQQQATIAAQMAASATQRQVGHAKLEGKQLIGGLDISESKSQVNADQPYSRV